MFQIIDPDKFTPSACWALTDDTTQYRHGMYSKQKATKRNLYNGIYKPCLTLITRKNLYGQYKIVLKIEFSVPKLLFGNNFEELQYKDRIPAIMKLVDVLQQMGIVTTPEIIANARISTIHYSKNIALTDGSTPYHFINKLKNTNIQLSLDTNQTDYRNEGYSYKWHCNSYEIIFYDKIKDLEKVKMSPRRTLEKDNEVQLNFLEIFKKRSKRKKLEILRMEVRLNNRRKIKQLFKKLGIKTNLIFKKLFKPAISKKILLHYLDELESKRPLLLDYKITSPKGLLVDLIFSNPDLNPKQVLQVYGLRYALDHMNLRELRVMFSRHSACSWYRLMADIKKINLPNIKQPPSSSLRTCFGVIRKHVLKYKPLRF